MEGAFRQMCCTMFIVTLRELPMKTFIQHPALILLLILVFAFIAADGIRIAQYHPRSTHVFRQSDCFAYTKRYYQDRSVFFTPACYNLIGKDGRVVSEFPILYYISAWLCHLFGFQYWIIRGVTWLAYLAGLFYLFCIVRRWIKPLPLALFPVVVLATTPYFFFYAVNFLPNVPAITLSFGGMYHLLRFGDTKRQTHFFTGTLFFIISVLLKPTDGGLVWGALAGAALFTNVDLAGSKRSVLLSSTIVVAFFVCWYLFVKQYNHVNGNDINLQGVYPIWDMPANEIYNTFTFRFFEARDERFHHWFFLWLSVLLFTIYLVRWKSLDRFLRMFTLFTLLGVAVYIPLWYKAFHVHDYYQLIYVVPAVFVAVTVLEYFSRTFFIRMPSPLRVAIAVLLFGAMVASIYFNQYIQLQRYSDSNPGFKNIDVIYELEPYLRKIGISKDETILSVGDGSPNITLAAMGNRGYSSDLFSVGVYDAKFAKQQGIHYMVLLDPSYTSDPRYAPYTQKLVGKYKFITIYDLR